MSKKEISKWVDYVSTKQEALGNFPICPFSKHATYEIIESNGYDIEPPPWDFELIIYKLPENLLFEDLVSIANEYNLLYPDLVFLPDGNRHTEINGVQTNNGKHNLLLCQYRSKLQDARNKLKNTNYYSYWNEEYLKEILNQ